MALFGFVPGMATDGLDSSNQDVSATDIDTDTELDSDTDASKDAGADIDTSPLSSQIQNNTQWYDDKGAEIRSNDGGHITKFGDTYYWVGNDLDQRTNGMDIHMYSSKTLGSSHWKWEGRMVDFEPNKYSGNCSLVKCPSTGKYLIIAKRLHFYESDSITGPYTLAKTIWKHQAPHPEYKL